MRHRLDSDGVGAKLKKLREARDLSMRALAQRAGVSVSFVSKVEAGKVCPTVMSLQKLLEAAETDLFEFFSDPTAADLAERVVFPKAEMALAEDEDHRWFYAFPRHPDIKAELTYEEYGPHSSISEKESHRGDFCGYLIAGELTLEIVDRGTFKAGVGDAFYIRAGQLHVARNDGDKVLKLVGVMLR